MRSQRLRRGHLQARPAGLRAEQGPRGQATALTWSAPPSVVQGGPGSFPTPMSHLGGSGMHQETPGLLPFLRGGAPRFGLFLPALLPPPSSRWPSWIRLFQAGPGGLQVSPSLPYRNPACRLLLRSPQQRKPGFAWWVPPVKSARRGWRLSSTLPGSPPASRVFHDLGDLC